MWNTGCQIVALNYQTEDKQNFLNRALFSNNGGCGYVLKPDYLLRPEDHNYSPLTTANMTSNNVKNPRRLTVKVISGHHIPRPDGKTEGEVIDPYVKVRVRGHADDLVDNKFKTSTCKNNGFNPMFDEEHTFTVRLPQLAFLEFRVKDHSRTGSDKLIGAYCCPLTLIQQGYRRVPLSTYGGKDLSPASLLIKINWASA